MSRFAGRVARAVAQGLGSEISFTLAGVQHVVRATQFRVGEDLDVLAGDLPNTANTWRVPAASLPSEPVPGTPVAVGGVLYVVDDCRPAGAVWLVTLTRRGAR